MSEGMKMLKCAARAAIQELLRIEELLDFNPDGKGWDSSQLTRSLRDKVLQIDIEAERFRAKLESDALLAARKEG